MTVSAPLVKTVAVGAQTGTLVWGTAGATNFSVTAANITDGKTGSVAWFSDSVGASPLGGNPTGLSGVVSSVTSNAATLTVSATTAVISGSYYFKVTFDGTTSALTTLTVNIFAGEGTEASPYEIGVAAQLAKLAELVNSLDFNYDYNNKYYKLTADINLNVAPYNTGTGWMPIGNQSNSFAYLRGSFDGDGKTISGLFINDSSMDYAGLFGSLINCTVKNLGVANVNITAAGSQYVGGVAGYAGSSSIINCYVSGTVNGYSRTGGVVGGINWARIADCYSAVNVTVPVWGDVGGVAFPAGSGQDHKNGADLSKANAKLQTTYSGIGWLFGDGTIEDNPWVWSGGAYPLPTLWWQTTPYPALPTHLAE